MEWNDHSRLILASASPRRKELLRLLEIPYRIVPALGEEQAVSALPWETVEQLSAQPVKWPGVIRTAGFWERIRLWLLAKKYLENRRMSRRLTGCSAGCREIRIRCIPV